MVRARITDIQNGVPRPSIGTINRRIWDISDEVYATGVPKLRAETIARCRKEGINYRTASVEHCMWRKYRGLVKQKGVDR